MERFCCRKCLWMGLFLWVGTLLVWRPFGLRLLVLKAALGQPALGLSQGAVLLSRDPLSGG